MPTYKLLFLPPDLSITHQVFPQEYCDEIRRITDATFNSKTEQYTEEELMTLVPGCDICITGWQSPCFTEKVMEKAEDLKVILHSAGTVKPYVSNAVFEKNVIVTTARAALARVTAESTLAMMMIGNWEVKKWLAVMEGGEWKQRDDFVPGIQGKTIGLIGYGAVTRSLLPLLKPFQDTRLVVYSHHLAPKIAEAEGLQKVSLEELLTTSDIISVQTSLTPKTHHMLNNGKLRLIKQDALLVNVGRGDLIDEDALIRYLQAGRFRAVLDVFSSEPLPPESPLRTLPNVICLPHLGAATYYCRRQLGKDVLDNLQDFLEGKAPRSQISKQEVFFMSEY